MCTVRDFPVCMLVMTCYLITVLYAPVLTSKAAQLSTFVIIYPFISLPAEMLQASSCAHATIWLPY